MWNYDKSVTAYSLNTVLIVQLLIFFGKPFSVIAILCAVVIFGLVFVGKKERTADNKKKHRLSPMKLFLLDCLAVLLLNGASLAENFTWDIADPINSAAALTAATVCIGIYLFRKDGKAKTAAFVAFPFFMILGRWSNENRQNIFGLTNSAVVMCVLLAIFFLLYFWNRYMTETVTPACKGDIPVVSHLFFAIMIILGLNEAEFLYFIGSMIKMNQNKIMKIGFSWINVIFWELIILAAILYQCKALKEKEGFMSLLALGGGIFFLKILFQYFFLFGFVLFLLYLWMVRSAVKKGALSTDLIPGITNNKAIYGMLLLLTVADVMMSEGFILGGIFLLVWFFAFARKNVAEPFHRKFTQSVMQSILLGILILAVAAVVTYRLCGTNMIFVCVIIIFCWYAMKVLYFPHPSSHLPSRKYGFSICMICLLLFVCLFQKGGADIVARDSGYKYQISARARGEENEINNRLGKVWFNGDIVACVITDEYNIKTILVKTAPRTWQRLLTNPD